MALRFECALFCLLVGCGPGGREEPSVRDRGNGSSGGGSNDAGAPDAPAFDPTQPTGGELFASNAKYLFRVDPVAKALSMVGEFAGCTGIQDVAVDEASNMYATNGTEIWRIDPNTAQCEGPIATSPTAGFPLAISFAPRGTVDPDEEALVGFTFDQEYLRVDLITGEVTLLGMLDQGYVLSGDFVSLIDAGTTYMSVNGGPNHCSDCLVEVDIKTGTVTKDWGPIGDYSMVSGLAYWGGKVYGFTPGYGGTNYGKVIEITLGTSTVTTEEIVFAEMPEAAFFVGAGSTTAAPSIPH